MHDMKKESIRRQATETRDKAKITRQKQEAKKKQTQDTFFKDCIERNRDPSFLLEINVYNLSICGYFFGIKQYT